MNLKEAAILISIMCSFEALAELPQGINRYTYCESCLATVQELKNLMRTPSTDPTDKRKLTDSVCEADIFKGVNLPTDKMKEACKHLLDAHGKDFNEVLLTRRADELDILLCYETSLACMGVKREQTQDNKKQEFRDKHVETLLQRHKDKVRLANPVHINPSLSAKEEL